MIKSFLNKLETIPSLAICSLIWITFVALSLYIAPYHEIWADEVQAFLIARDASVSEIILNIPHQEGQPSLWHLLLKGLIFLFGDNLNITYISIFIMSLTVAIFLFCYNVPIVYKILIPFGHYFLYQYNIISRNYCLAYLALVLLGCLYPLRHKYTWRYIFVLILLAMSTSFFAPIAAVLGSFWIYEAYKSSNLFSSRYILPFTLLACCGIALIWLIFPINMLQYDLRIKFIDNYPYNVLAHIPETFFAGQSLLINLLFLLAFWYIATKNAVSLDFYSKIRRNLQNVLYLLIIIFSFFLGYLAARPVYYHQGLIWGLFLISIYILFPNYARSSKHYLFILILFMHIYWSFVTIRYDINNPVSAQDGVTQVLKSHNKLNVPIKAIGYHTIPFQATVPTRNLLKRENEAVYARWTVEELTFREQEYLSLPNTSYDVLVLDLLEVDQANADLSSYDPQHYYFYKIPAALCHKGYICYEQGMLVFIKKN